MPRKASDMPLTRESILKAAAQLLSKESVDAFSMRKLATMLQVNPMAVYYYLPNKEALLQEVIEEALSHLTFPKADDWRSAIRYVAKTYHDFALMHRELFMYVIMNDRSIAVAFAIDEYLVAALAQANISPRLIVQIVYMVLDTIAGLTLSEIKGSLGRSRDVTETYQAFTELPAHKFPAIRAIAQQINPVELQLDFDFAVAVLIAGIEAQLALKAG